MNDSWMNIANSQTFRESYSEFTKISGNEFCRSFFDLNDLLLPDEKIFLQSTINNELIEKETLHQYFLNLELGEKNTVENIFLLKKFEAILKSGIFKGNCKVFLFFTIDFYLIIYKDKNG